MTQQTSHELDFIKRALNDELLTLKDQYICKTYVFGTKLGEYKIYAELSHDQWFSSIRFDTTFTPSFIFERYVKTKDLLIRRQSHFVAAVESLQSHYEKLCADYPEALEHVARWEKDLAKQEDQRQALRDLIAGCAAAGAKLKW